ncbi:MAG TPA: family 43 glycosylhydrolase [Gemmatimonadaceae bacterium]|nr:family 43 glycosylhydrolase [Gemmatimonadaceae bacterium]
MRALVLVAALLAATACGRNPAPAAAPVAEAPPFATGPIAPRSTFCNPLDIDYRFMVDTPSRREAADPVITLFDDEYYLFASKGGGYWHSPDMRDWQLVVPDGLPLEEYAPAILVLDGRMYYTAHKSMALYTTDDPVAGKWRKVADLASYADPAFFLDDDGRVYLYHGSSLDGGISVVELDPRKGFRVVDGPHELMHANHAEHGWERSGADNLGAAGMRDGFRIAPYIEGAWMTEHDGTYYLQYSAPGTIWKSYGDGVYTSRSPTSGFTYAPYSPFSYKPGGFIGGAGHAATFRDKRGNYWRVVTMIISVAHKFERRLGIFPAGFDSAGVMRTNTYLGDYPQLLPGLAADPLDRNTTGWMLLSAGKDATASSTLAGRAADLAFDEDVRTWWSAATGGVGEWLSVDLGRIERVFAIQVNFAEERTQALGRDEDSYQQYIIESSIDGLHWTTRLDESGSVRDRPHRYVQLDTARNARFVRITNVHAAAGGSFAVRDFRVFGASTAPRPPEVRDVVVERQADDRGATIGWTRSPGATSYVIRFGIAPDRLYSSYEVGDVDRLTINSLNRGVAYWFAVDAVGEGGVTRGRDEKQG